ncbi:phosphatase inhibitor-domain-containing protein [Lanmaoa asiatica]|nr:phosphatase inhibitor-domain-containing protein [Lanmaoa asiatica]
MTTATQRRPHTSAPTDGSRTITLRDAQPRRKDEDGAGGGAGPSSGEPNTAVGVLKLRGAQRRTRQRVAWDTDVVDNEGCGKKKSKICCIYHKPRRFDESSSESESASPSDSDSDSGGGQHYGGDRARPTRHYHHASHGHGCGHNTVRREGQGGAVHELHQSDSGSGMNAYERAPKRKC